MDTWKCFSLAFAVPGEQARDPQSMKHWLRKSVTGLVLSTPAGARAALRCALDERFLNRLLADPLFTERVLAVRHLRERLIRLLTGDQVLASLLAAEDDQISIG